MEAKNTIGIYIKKSISSLILIPLLYVLSGCQNGETNGSKKPPKEKKNPKTEVGYITEDQGPKKYIFSIYPELLAVYKDMNYGRSKILERMSRKTDKKYIPKPEEIEQAKKIASAYRENPIISKIMGDELLHYNANIKSFENMNMEDFFGILEKIEITGRKNLDEIEKQIFFKEFGKKIKSSGIDFNQIVFVSRGTIPTTAVVTNQNNPEIKSYNIDDALDQVKTLLAQQAWIASQDHQNSSIGSDVIKNFFDELNKIMIKDVQKVYFVPIGSIDSIILHYMKYITGYQIKSSEQVYYISTVVGSNKVFGDANLFVLRIKSKKKLDIIDQNQKKISKPSDQLKYVKNVMEQSDLEEYNRQKKRIQQTKSKSKKNQKKIKFDKIR